MLHLHILGLLILIICCSIIAGHIIFSLIILSLIIFFLIIIILIIATFLAKFRNSKLVESAFYGLRPASVGLIAAAGVSISSPDIYSFVHISDTQYSTALAPYVFQEQCQYIVREKENLNIRCDTIYDLISKTDVNIFHILLAAVIFVATNYIPKIKKWHPLCFILFSAVIGIVLKF